MRRHILLTVALCSAVSFLLGTLITGGVHSVPAVATVSGAQVRPAADGPGQGRGVAAGGDFATSPNGSTPRSEHRRRIAPAGGRRHRADYPDQPRASTSRTRVRAAFPHRPQGSLDQLPFSRPPTYHGHAADGAR